MSLLTTKLKTRRLAVKSVTEGSPGPTGRIRSGSSFVTVASSNANLQIMLPKAKIGDIIYIKTGSTGCELISVVSTHKINNVLVGATNELALASNSLYECEYVSTDNWIVTGYNNVGALLGPTTAALTTITPADAVGTPDYAIAAITQTTPFGFASAQEAITTLYVIQNLQVQMAELRAAAKLIPDAL